MFRKAIRIVALALSCLLAAGQAAAAPHSPLTEPLALEGKLSVLVADDFRNKRAHLEYSLVVRPGYRVPIEFAPGTAPAGLHTGMAVRASGSFDGRRLRIDGSAGFRVLDAAPAAAPSQFAVKALVMLVDVKDGNNLVHGVDQSCDANGDSADIMFGTLTSEPNVDGAYVQSSFGKEGVGGAAYPGNALDVLRVQVSDATTAFSAVCNVDDWANQADAVATAAGMKPGDYTHRVYVLPQNTGCGWGGLGEVACGTDCRSWQSTYSYYLCGTRGAHAHELGHNRGFMHASTDAGNDGVIDSEYGDTSDFMGNNFDTIQQTNSPHKVQLGWIDAAHVIDVPSGAGGTFTIAASELANATLPQVIRLTPASGSPYYLSYRTNAGYDANLPDATWYQFHTNVHRWDGGATNTRYIRAIADGQYFVDDGNQLAITQLSHDAQSATIRIDRNVVCTRAAPGVVMTPASQTVSSLPGSVTYSITVTNNDSYICPPSYFQFSNSSDNPYIGGNLSMQSATIAPGQSVLVTNQVPVTTEVANGTYTIYFGTVVDSIHASVQKTSALVVNAGPSCTYAALTGSLSPDGQTASSLPHAFGLTFSITNNDHGSGCTATTFNLASAVPPGWTNALSNATLSIAPGATANATITATAPAGTANGTYQVAASTAADAHHASLQLAVLAFVNVQTCVRNAPVTELAPTTQTVTALPATITYTFMLSNADSAVCASTTFTPVAKLPAGWNGSFSPARLSVVPGGSSATTLTVKVPSSAVNNTYAIGVDTKADSTHAVVHAGASAVVNVASTADTTPPTKPGTLSGSLVNGSVVLNWGASTDGGSGLANYKVYRNGASWATTTATTLTKTTTRGTWTFYVVAVDKAGNVSAASNTISLTK